MPWQIRVRRAVALQKLGRIFQDVGQVERCDLTQPNAAKQQLEEAIFGSIRESR